MCIFLGSCGGMDRSRWIMGGELNHLVRLGSLIRASGRQPGLLG